MNWSSQAKYFVSFAGGNDNGRWHKTHVTDIIDGHTRLDGIILPISHYKAALGYTGVAFDMEYFADFSSSTSTAFSWNETLLEAAY